PEPAAGSRHGDGTAQFRVSRPRGEWRIAVEDDVDVELVLRRPVSARGEGPQDGAGAVGVEELVAVPLGQFDLTGSRLRQQEAHAARRFGHLEAGEGRTTEGDADQARTEVLASAHRGDAKGRRFPTETGRCGTRGHGAAG